MPAVAAVPIWIATRGSSFIRSTAAEDPGSASPSFRALSQVCLGFHKPKFRSLSQDPTAETPTQEFSPSIRSSLHLDVAMNRQSIPQVDHRDAVHRGSPPRIRDNKRVSIRWRRDHMLPQPERGDAKMWPRGHPVRPRKETLCGRPGFVPLRSGATRSVPASE